MPTNFTAQEDSTTYSLTCKRDGDHRMMVKFCAVEYGAWGDRWWTLPVSRESINICFKNKDDVLHFALTYGEKILDNHTYTHN